MNCDYVLDPAAALIRLIEPALDKIAGSPSRIKWEHKNRIAKQEMAQL